MEPVNVGDLVVAKPNRLGSALKRGVQYPVLDIKHMHGPQLLISFPGSSRRWWMGADRFELSQRAKGHLPTDAGAAEYEEIMAVQRTER